MKTLLFQLVLLLGATFALQAQEVATEKKMEIPELQSYQQIFNHLRSVNNDVMEKYSFYKSASRDGLMSENSQKPVLYEPDSNHYYNP